jgi:hypothetical protein
MHFHGAKTLVEINGEIVPAIEPPEVEDLIIQSSAACNRKPGVV